MNQINRNENYYGKTKRQIRSDGEVEKEEEVEEGMATTLTLRWGMTQTPTMDR